MLANILHSFFRRYVCLVIFLFCIQAILLALLIDSFNSSAKTIHAQYGEAIFIPVNIVPKPKTDAPPPMVNKLENNSPILFRPSGKMNLGKVIEGSDVSENIQLVNTSLQNIRLLAINASCGCSSISKTTDVVRSGESLSVPVKIKTQGRHGYLSVAFDFVYTLDNDPKQRVDVFFIEMDIIQPGNIQAHPQVLNWGHKKSGTPVSEKINLHFIEDSTSDALPQILKIDSPHWLQCTLYKEHNNDYILTLEGITPNSDGNVREQIVIKTDNAKYPNLPIPILLKISGEVYFVPDNIIRIVNADDFPLTLDISIVFRKKGKILPELTELTVLEGLTTSYQINPITSDTSHTSQKISVRCERDDTIKKYVFKGELKVTAKVEDTLYSLSLPILIICKND